jgi:hypothetical protein
MSDNTIFGRYEKVFLLLLGFILTTIGGTLIGSYLQTRNRFKAQQEEVFTEIARQMDLRAYRTDQLLSGLQGDVEYASLEVRRREYRTVLEDWNMNRNRNHALVERYFGAHAGDCFTRIHANFLNINRSIRRKADYLATSQQDMETLRRQIYVFDRYLLKSVSAGLLSRSAGRCRVPAIPVRATQGGIGRSDAAR